MFNNPAKHKISGYTVQSKAKKPKKTLPVDHACILSSTLESGINVRSGIMVRVGQFVKNNNGTVCNKHTGGKSFE